MEEGGDEKHFITLKATWRCFQSRTPRHFLLWHQTLLKMKVRWSPKGDTNAWNGKGIRDLEKTQLFPCCFFVYIAHIYSRATCWLQPRAQTHLLACKALDNLIATYFLSLISLYFSPDLINNLICLFPWVNHACSMHLSGHPLLPCPMSSSLQNAKFLFILLRPNSDMTFVCSNSS